MRTTTIYTCTSCDAQSPKWTGQCLECGAWSTMTASAAPPKGASRGRTAPPPSAVVAMSEIPSVSERRLSTGLAELDRVLGGGIVAGSVSLIGGEPGIGKSTLALMAAAKLAAGGRKVIYASGEESASQVKMRADRLGAAAKGLLFLSETDADALVATLEHERPDVAVIDSVQTVKANDIPSEAGAATQVRAAAAKLVTYAKSSGTPLIVIGHVTKDGSVAGPKTLEHVVDAVFSFEGERGHPLRILRSLKNRFGSTDETGIFEMRDAGLAEVPNPSAYLLEARQDHVPGSVVSCVMEGTRPILVEVQALVQATSFGYPTRRSSGIDAARLEMILAVLASRGGVDLGQHDVYVNVVGGLKVRETAVDLAVALAIVSAFRRTPLPKGLAAWGEVGLGGEVRPVSSAERRVNEASLLGIDAVVTAMPRAAKERRSPKPRVTDVRTIRDAVAAMALGNPAKAAAART